MAEVPAYRVDDRSILLPYYKRFVIEPTLPLIPARVHPNAITHAGHLVCLAGAALLVAAQPPRAWAFVAAAALLQGYVWCDNADGGHARRTGQTSATGEFLDHGLDIVNTVYVALMTMCALRSSPAYAVGLAVLVPAATSLTCWEQAETGTFHLGVLNQIESLAVLSATLLVAAAWGPDVFHRAHLGPVTAWHALHLWPFATITYGLLRGLQRVARGGRPLAPALALLAALAAVGVAGARGDVAPAVAVALAFGVNVYFAARMLARRFRREPAQADPLVGLTLVVVGGISLARAAGPHLPPALLAALALALVLALALSSLGAAREGYARVARSGR